MTLKKTIASNNPWIPFTTGAWYRLFTTSKYQRNISCFKTMYDGSTKINRKAYWPSCSQPIHNSSFFSLLDTTQYHLNKDFNHLIYQLIVKINLIYQTLFVVVWMNQFAVDPGECNKKLEDMVSLPLGFPLILKCYGVHVAAIVIVTWDATDWIFTSENLVWNVFLKIVLQKKCSLVFFDISEQAQNPTRRHHYDTPYSIFGEE